MKEKIRIVVVDDHPLFRDGVINTIMAEDDMDVVGNGSTADEAISLTKRELPDVLLLDISLPGNGLTAAGIIAELCPVTKIIMLTVSEDEEDVLQAFRAGAKGYVLKGVSASDLARIIREINSGVVYVTPKLASRVLVELSDNTRSDKSGKPIDTLTERERQILERVASGEINKEIAYNLSISEKTVKHYMTNIMQKLHARNRVEAALLAYDAGLGKLPEQEA
jgi:DNA-binding NarL/FixJ family response regulator